MFTVPRTLLPLIAAGLLFTASAEGAQQPIPALVNTAQYQNLFNYVKVLEGKTTVPVSEETRTSYQTSLTNKASLATTRLTALFNNRKSRATNTNRANFQKKAKKVQRSERARLNRAKSALDKDLAKERRQYQAAVKRIKNQYGSEIKQLKASSKKLKASLAQTRNPRKIAILENRIEENGVLLQNLNQEQSADTAVQLRRLKRSATLARRNHQADIDRIELQADRAIRKIRQASNLSLQTRINTLTDQRATERSLITAQVEAGQAAINAMPALIV